MHLTYIQDVTNRFKRVAKFKAHGDPSHFGQAWKRWLRSFELFAGDKGVRASAQKKALLLHCAGLDVQDIFFSLNDDEPQASAAASKTAQQDDKYKKTVTILKEHFTTG